LQFRVFREPPKMLRNLLCELARRRQNQRRSLTGRPPLEQFLNQRDAESGGFAAAGWSAGEDVATGQSNGNSRLLNGRGLGILEVFDATNERSIQGEFGKN
jgi:hypothetical protein